MVLWKRVESIMIGAIVKEAERVKASRMSSYRHPVTNTQRHKAQQIQPEEIHTESSKRDVDDWWSLIDESTTECNLFSQAIVYIQQTITYSPRACS